MYKKLLPLWWLDRNLGPNTAKYNGKPSFVSEIGQLNFRMDFSESRLFSQAKSSTSKIKNFERAPKIPPLHSE